jgi:hypothetical protein
MLGRVSARHLASAVSMARISFIVQGLSPSAAAAGEIVRALHEHNFSGARFDSGTHIFSVEIDPAVHSFADVRRAIDALGKSQGLVYLAVVMSP